MEKFNIELFRSLATDDEYIKTLDDSTVVDQMELESGFVEKRTPAKGWFYEYKEYYKSGQLRTKGRYFICGDYKDGEWVECDEKGNVTDKTDYNKLYKLSLDSVLAILQKNDIPFTRANRSNSISRNIENSKGTWYVEWKVVPDRVEIVNIEDSTGKIVLRSFEKFRSRN